jgi:NAD(P)-dependent dehydrogenase (short-subunit alcohol dehydrogenase family)
MSTTTIEPTRGPAPDFALDGQVALVTGSSRGIGRAIAQALARQGASVVVTGRTAADVEATAAAITAAGGAALALPIDVTAPGAPDALVDQTLERLGRIDVLVNNVGSAAGGGSLLDIDPSRWEAALSVNVTLPWMLSRRVAQQMVAQGDGGAIVNVSSIVGSRAAPNLGAYSVAKAALNMLTRVLAAELGRHMIRVNGVGPGVIQTEFSRAVWDNPTVIGPLMSQTPLGRIAQADEVAGAVVFLASPAAAYITGQTLLLDGGRSA